MTWLRTEDARIRLGVTRRYLTYMKEQGQFKYGVHYRNIGTSAKRPTYQFNVDAINKYLNKEVEKRQ